MPLDFCENNWKSTCARRLTGNEHKKRQKVQKEKDEIWERIRPKLMEKSENRHPWLQSQLSHATEVWVLQSHTTQVRVLQSHTTQVRVLQSHTTQVRVLQSHTTEVRVLQSHTTEVRVLQSHTTEVRVLQSHTTEVRVLQSHTTQVRVLQSHTTEVRVLQSHTTQVRVLQSHTTEVRVSKAQITHIHHVLPHTSYVIWTNGPVAHLDESGPADRANNTNHLKSLILNWALIIKTKVLKFIQMYITLCEIHTISEAQVFCNADFPEFWRRI